MSRKKAAERVTLEEQLSVLRQIGIAPCCDDFAEWVLTDWKREDIEADPYNLLLFSLGGEREHDGRWQHLSDDVYCFDTECVEDDGIYAEVFMNLSRISKGEFNISGAVSAVDHDEGTSEVSFTYRGTSYHWCLEYDGDWFDTAVFGKINALIAENGYTKMFHAAYPDQGVRLIYGEGEFVERVNGLVAPPFVPTLQTVPSMHQPAPKSEIKPNLAPKKKGHDTYIFVMMVLGMLLIAALGIYQINAGRAANMAGDYGFANFFITPEALERCDFTDVIYNWDCH